jgi:putative two-component system response regulator
MEFTDLGPSKILIVDDQDLNVRLMETLLQSEGYSTVSASNGRVALAMAVVEKPDLILLDIMMPDMDGFETVKYLKADLLTQNIPVIMVTALDDQEKKIKALQAGAEEFLTKPVVRVDLVVKVRNLLRLKKYGDLLNNQKTILEEQVRIRTAELEASYRNTVLTLVRAAEGKDAETGKHIQRVSFYCKLIAVAMELSVQTCEAIFHASPMHDIGKIGVPDSVLLKVGQLSDEEWVIMKTHCAAGAIILSTGTSPYVRMGAEIALNHHERWDGSG